MFNGMNMDNIKTLYDTGKIEKDFLDKLNEMNEKLKNEDLPNYEGEIASEIASEDVEDRSL